jgi:chromosome segregation ATPase
MNQYEEKMRGLIETACLNGMELMEECQTTAISILTSALAEEYKKVDDLLTIVESLRGNIFNLNEALAEKDAELKILFAERLSLPKMVAERDARIKELEKKLKNSVDNHLQIISTLYTEFELESKIREALAEKDERIEVLNIILGEEKSRRDARIKELEEKVKVYVSVIGEEPKRVEEYTKSLNDRIKELEKGIAEKDTMIEQFKNNGEIAWQKVKQLEEANRWIPVEEKDIPDGVYLVYYEIDAQYVIERAVLNDGIWFTLKGSIIEGVTHYRKITPPKEE